MATFDLIKKLLKGSTTLPVGTAQSGHDHAHHHHHEGGCCGHDHAHDHDHDHHTHAHDQKDECCGSGSCDSKPKDKKDGCCH